MPKDPVARRILTSEGHFEQRLEKSIELLKGYKLNVVESILGDLGYKCKMNPADRDRLFLSWDELQEMAESGLISFGSHTDNHHILTTLAESEIVKELQESRDKLLAQGIVKADFIPFCCPNGNYTERIADMVKKAGYSVAVTTRRLWNRRECDPYTLKRIGIHQDMASTESLFACRVANIF